MMVGTGLDGCGWMRSGRGCDAVEVDGCWVAVFRER